jgi:hypothetical protein
MKKLVLSGCSLLVVLFLGCVPPKKTAPATGGGSQDRPARHEPKTPPPVEAPKKVEKAESKVADEAAKDKVEEPKNKDGVEEGTVGMAADTVEVTETESGVTITGTVINRKDRDLEFIMVVFELYDASGRRIGDARISNNELKAGKSWSFKLTRECRGFHRLKVAALVITERQLPPTRETTTPKTTGSAADNIASGTTSTGKTIYTGPRGGQYHYSKSGKKVYERKK